MISRDYCHGSVSEINDNIEFVIVYEGLRCWIISRDYCHGSASETNENIEYAIVYEDTQGSRPKCLPCVLARTSWGGWN